MKRPPRSRPRSGRSRSGRPAYGRRTPPPERTGLEAAFLAAIAESGAKLTASLESGETVSGVVESFDRDMITLRPDDGPALVLRKTDIRWVSEQRTR